MSMEQKQFLSDISNHLTLNAPNMSDIGLFQGKMGVVLFFYLYSRYTQSGYYQDFADILLDEVVEELDTSLNISLKNGLSGIGWSLEYLVQNNFIEGDTSEILHDINLTIMNKADFSNCCDFSFESGLSGVVFYIKTHLSSPVRENKSLPFPPSFLSNLVSVIKKNKLDNYPFCSFLKYMHRPFASQDRLTLSRFLAPPKNGYEREIYKNCSLGLHGGLAGIGINLMLS